MEFQVPQFIDIEDKIFGPFTFRQFLYLLGGVGGVFLFYKLLPLYIAIFLIIPWAALSAALVFYRVNNRPFIQVLESWFHFSLAPKLYLWKKAPNTNKQAASDANPPAGGLPVIIPKLSESKLKDMSWSLDVLDVKKK